MEGTETKYRRPCRIHVNSWGEGVGRERGGEYRVSNVNSPFNE